MIKIKEEFCMSQVILYLLFFVYVYFADQAISYVKANILGIQSEIVYGSLITKMIMTI